MTYEQTASLNMVGAAGFSGISVPGDSIFDNIFDWVANIIPSTINAMGDNVVKIINAVGDNVVSVITAVSTSTVSVITAIGNTVATITSIISSGVVQVITATANGLSSVIASIASGTSQVISATANGLSSVIASIASGTSQVIASMAFGFASVTASVSQLIASIAQTVVGTFGALSAQVQSNFTWITGWLATSIPQILGAWWDSFIGKVFDFGSWVGKLFDAVSAWVTRDIPGYSPWWQMLLKTLFPQWSMFFFTQPGEQYKGPIQSTFDTINVSLGWLGKLFNKVVSDFTDGIVGWVGDKGPIDPSGALARFNDISGIGMTVLAGLAGMTLASMWLKPLGDVGLGHIAAMVYDMTNYKLITGALIGVLVSTAIRAPLTYFYNNKFRPAIPSIRELSDMYTDESLTRAEFGQYLAYHGIADAWHDKYAGIAYRAMSPYQLKTAAQDGSFDEGIFSRELTHAGFRPETKKMLLDSFRKASMTNIKTYSVSSATYRFKKGFTNEQQFTSELQLSQVGDAMLPVYLALTRLDYASDYLTDLETAYQNAVRSGQIGVDEYRQALLDLGMVPDRVEGKVFIEQARIKPSAALGPVAGAKAYYLTDAGKIIIDTNRRRRRAGNITRDQELAAFSNIGMPVDLAAAYADNDDARLKEPTAAAGG